jgi:hypothetical protein
VPGEVGRQRVLGYAHLLPRPAGQLLGGVRRAREHRADLGEPQPEHVVQHERHPLGGCEPIEHDQQRPADRVGQLGLLLRVGARAVRGFRELPSGGLFASRGPGAQRVQAHAGDHGRQPAGDVVHAARVGAAEPQPRLLHGIVGLGGRAEHPQRDGAQVWAVLLEHVVVGHRSPSVRHRCDGSERAEVTVLRA